MIRDPVIRQLRKETPRSSCMQLYPQSRHSNAVLTAVSRPPRDDQWRCYSGFAALVIPTAFPEMLSHVTHAHFARAEHEI